MYWYEPNFSNKERTAHCFQLCTRTREPEWRCCRCAANTRHCCRALSPSAPALSVCPLLSTRPPLPPPPPMRRPQVACFSELSMWPVRSSRLDSTGSPHRLSLSHLIVYISMNAIGTLRTCERFMLQSRREYLPLLYKYALATPTRTAHLPLNH